MFHTSVRQQIVRMLNYGLLLGAVTWVFLAINAAQSLKNVGQGARDITFGPLTLTHISKLPAEGGSNVQFSFEPGLAWYIVFWLAVGGMLGLVFAWQAHKALRAGKHA